MNRSKAVLAFLFVMAALVAALAQQNQSTSTQTSTSKNGRSSATATASSSSQASGQATRSVNAGSAQMATSWSTGSAMEIDKDSCFVARGGMLKRFTKNGLAPVAEIKLGDGETYGQTPVLRLDEDYAYVLQGSKLYQVTKSGLEIVTVRELDNRNGIR